MLDRLRKTNDVIFARSPADQVNLLATGIARYGIAYSNRIIAAQRDGLPISFHWNQGIRTGNGAAMLRGAHNVDKAIALLEFALRREVQADFARRAGFERATGMDDRVSPDEAPDAQVTIDSGYWSEHRADVGARWVRWLVQ
jgi:putative spermidine/putrescine transport system substrate-binding protein